MGLKRGSKGNAPVFHFFQNRLAGRVKNGNISTDGTYFYSYEMEIGAWGLDGEVEIIHPRHSPSVTTTNHINALRSVFNYAPRLVDALRVEECKRCHGHHIESDTRRCDFLVALRDSVAALDMALASGRPAVPESYERMLTETGVPFVKAPWSIDEYKGTIADAISYRCFVDPWVIPLVKLHVSPSVKRQALKRALTDAEFLAAIEGALAGGKECVEAFTANVLPGLVMSGR